MSDCTICFDPFSSVEKVSVLPCGHCFHVDCVEKWGRTVVQNHQDPRRKHWAIRLSVRLLLEK